VFLADSSGTDAGGHHGSRDRAGPQHDAAPYDAPDRIRNVLAVDQALACSVLAATNPVISSAESAIESFISASSVRNL
jgi:hypothetical protein